MVQKLYGATVDLLSGFAELGALGIAITLLLWVSGLFFGLAFMSVFVSLACVYVLAVSSWQFRLTQRSRHSPHSTHGVEDCLALRLCITTPTEERHPLHESLKFSLTVRLNESHSFE